MVSIVIPYVNRKNIGLCKELIRKHTKCGYEILDWEDKYRSGYGSSCNFIRSRAKGEYILFLNDDTLFCNDVASILSSYLKTHPDVRAVGPYVMNSRGDPGIGYGRFPRFHLALAELLQLHRIFPDLSRGRKSKSGTFPVDYVSGCCLMIRANDPVWFNPNFKGYYEETDLCKRLGSVVYHSEAILTHLGGQSYTSDKADCMKKGLKLYCQRHCSVLTYPAYVLAETITQRLRRIAGRS